MSFEERGPGLLFVNSKIIKPDQLDEKTFIKWYDEDHIPEALATSGMHSGYRMIDSTHPKEAVDRPYLAIYPIEDISFFKTDEFKGIHLTSPILPTTDPIGHWVDFDVRYAKLVQVYDPTNKGPGKTKSIILAQMQLKPDFSEEELDKWYREEHNQHLAQAPGYLRTTRYEVVFARGASKDEIAGGTDSVPKWIAIHEFETPEIDLPAILSGATPWTKKVVAGCSDVRSPVFVMAKLHGNGDMHHGRKMD